MSSIHPLPADNKDYSPNTASKDHNLLLGLSLDGTQARFQQQSNANGRTIQVGYDLGSSAPKSFSIVHAMADPGTRRAIRDIQHRAVKQVIAHLESNTAFRQ